MRRLLATLSIFALCSTFAAAQDTDAQSAMRKAVKNAKISVDWKDTLVQDVVKELAEKLEEDGKVKGAKVKADSIVTGLTQNQKITYSAKGKTVHDIIEDLGKKYSLGYVVLGKDDPKGKYKAHKKADGTLLITKSDERGDIKKD